MRAGRRVPRWDQRRVRDRPRGLLCADYFGFQKGIDGLCIPSTRGAAGGGSLNGSSASDGAVASAPYVVETVFQLDMALADFDAASFRTVLAAQYGVPASAIVVSAAAGNLVVKVLIALRGASDAVRVSASIRATPTRPSRAPRRHGHAHS